MQKFLAKILLFSLALSLVFGQAVGAVDSTVYFVGGADDFVIFTNRRSLEEINLFGNFEDMMPGDVRDETITVRNVASEYDKVKIFLRADTDENNVATRDFLSEFSLTVKNGDEVIYDGASPDGSAGLNDDILLGTFEDGDETVLSLRLVASPSMSSRHMFSSGTVDWIFTAEAYLDGEEVPTSNKPNRNPPNNGGENVPNGPNTFDGILKPFLIFLMAFLTLWIIVLWLRKREREQVAKRRNRR